MTTSAVALRAMLATFTLLVTATATVTPVAANQAEDRTIGDQDRPPAGKRVPLTMSTTSECTVPTDANDDVLLTLKHVLDREQVTATVRLATYEAAWVESHANNLPCGDADSVGVFQQRPSTGWGTTEQIMDVANATANFLWGNPSDTTPGAIELHQMNPDWAAWEIAQGVQRSCCPSRYAEARDTALALIDRAALLDVIVDDGLSASENSDGTQTLFARSGPSGRLAVKRPHGTGWETWNEPHATTRVLGSGPDATTRKLGYFDVVARASDGTVQLARKAPGQAWQNFTTDFGPSVMRTQYAPAVVSISSSHMFIFATRESDGALMSSEWVQFQGWHEWRKVGNDSGLTSGPDATKKFGEEAAAVAVRGPAGEILLSHWKAGSSWSGFVNHGAPAAHTKTGTAPALASREHTGLDLMVGSPSGTMHRRVIYQGRIIWDWHKPNNLNDETISAGPDITAVDGNLRLFARNANGLHVHTQWTKGQGQDNWNGFTAV